MYRNMAAHCEPNKQTENKQTVAQRVIIWNHWRYFSAQWRTSWAAESGLERGGAPGFPEISCCRGGAGVHVNTCNTQISPARLARNCPFVLASTSPLLLRTSEVLSESGKTGFCRNVFVCVEVYFGLDPVAPPPCLCLGAAL